MTIKSGALQNDPNNGLRFRLEPEQKSSPTAQESLTQALKDLQEMARDRLPLPDPGRRRWRKRRR